MIEKKLLGLLALKAIAEHILTVPDKQWNMQKWLSQERCGTIGCAIGHSINLPEVKATGLKLVYSGDVFLGIARYYPTLSGSIEGPTYVAFKEIADAFALDVETARHLFDPSYYFDGLKLVIQPLPDPTQKEVSNKILETIKELIK